jgi:hypothetical protein
VDVVLEHLTWLAAANNGPAARPDGCAKPRRGTFRVAAAKGRSSLVVGGLGGGLAGASVCGWGRRIGAIAGRRAGAGRGTRVATSVARALHQSPTDHSEVSLHLFIEPNRIMKFVYSDL